MSSAISGLLDQGVPEPATTVLDSLVERGHKHFTGVPCSLLKGLFRHLESGSHGEYFAAPREDTALGVASGLAVCGHKPVVLMQNSGLGYGLNVLTSFTLIYDVHLPLVISWRGHDENDAVEHDVIGRELGNLLDIFGIRWNVLEPAFAAKSVGEWLDAHDEGSHTAALIVTEGI